MAGNITINCPECDKPLKASSDLLGKKIRCKACGAVFPARGDSGQAAPKGKKPAKKGDADPDTVAYKMTEEYLGRRCPYCANAMEEGARICLECGYDTMTREKANLRKVRETTGFDIFMWLLPAGLVALLVLGLLGGCTWYWLGVDKTTFGPEDVWYSALAASLFTKVYLSVIVLFIAFFGGRFAIRRLVFHYMPPEIEEKFIASPR
jgi:hypothetical protein